LNGLLVADSGDVWVDGIRVAQNPAKAREKVGMVFQDADGQIVGETVFEDVAFGPRNLGWPPQKVFQQVNQALDVVGLLDMAEQAPYLLSGGEKRRLAIAGVLAMDPAVVAFDEPFSNLDYPGVQQVLGQMVAMVDAGRTVLVTTHDLEKVIAHAHRLVILAKGRVVQDGPPAAVIKAAEAFGVREPCASRMGMEAASWLR
jgi:biotin transport system ATP-binding protein